MILYVNGDSHAAAGEAVNGYCFAEDDPKYRHLGRAPHPDNLAVSWGAHLAKELVADLVCEAESASSNSRIMRTTREYLDHSHADMVVIGWSTWEREEWLHDGVYWQVNAGGVGEDWPEEIKKRYTHWVLSTDYERKRAEQHELIFEFHLELEHRGQPHVFFNTFDCLPSHFTRSWGYSYVHPYSKAQTYYNLLLGMGLKTVNPNSYHFGPDAHRVWARFIEGSVWRELDKYRPVV